MPYLDSPMDIHFGSKPMGYTRASPNHFANDHQDQDEEEWWSIECEVPAARIVPIAPSYESHGHDVYLNVITGEITEIIRAASEPSLEPLESWLEDMMEAYRFLRIIPCTGRIAMDCFDAPEREAGLGRISEEEFRAQTGYWRTELEVQYVRQVYRDFGWPGTFRKDEAFGHLQNLLISIAENIGDIHWAEASEDRDPRSFKDRC